MSVEKSDSGHHEECDIFVSYSHEGTDHDGKVAKLVEELKKKGWIVRFDQENKTEPDLSWAAYMGDLLTKARHVIIVLSQTYGQRRGSRAELNALRNMEAWDSQKQHLSQVYFDPAYEKGPYRRKHAFPDLGGSVYGLANEPIPENEKWESLIQRISASLSAQQKEATDMEPYPDQPEKKHENGAKIEKSTGIILVGDIKSFSDKKKFPKNTQHQVLRQMWNFITQNQLITQLKCPVDSTLDGAVIVFDEEGHDDDVPLEAYALKFAEEWINFMQNKIEIQGRTLPVEFRIGIDKEDYSLFSFTSTSDKDSKKIEPKTEPAFRNYKIIGAGPNDCDRLTRIGDAYDIILSSRFFEDWKRETQQSGVGMVYPAPDDPPFEVFPKPHHRQEVRVYVGHRKDPAPRTPIILRQTKFATDAIWKCLADMADDYRDWLIEDLLTCFGEVGEHEAETERQDLKVILNLLERDYTKLRVSIFCPKPDQPEALLSCTTFRHLEGVRKGSREFERLKKPCTLYPLKGRGAGIVGQAFKQTKPIVLWDLPDWEVDQIGYIKKMKKHELDEKSVRAFPRHPRVTIAFRAQMGDLPPDACICLDAMHGLGGYFEKKTFTLLAQYLQNTYGSMISLLLRAKG